MSRRASALTLGMALALVACGSSPPPVQPTAGGASGTPGVEPRLRCERTADCVYFDREPCPCGTRPASAYEAIRRDWPISWPTATETCVDCASEPEPGVYPICDAGRCVVLDVAATELSRCTIDAECVAVDAGCCPPCATRRQWVALARGREAELRGLRCSPESELHCPLCATDVAIPPDVVCDRGHCALAEP